ncbi:MAG: hypothetical protein KIT27_08795 [Legionellales bacterium]|nr:hypothetical protein [Legionellales bacterium]
MKRKIISVILVVLLMSLSLPIIFGWVIKYYFIKQINQLNVPQQFSLKVLEYHQSYWYSSARLEFTILNPELIKSNPTTMPLTLPLLVKIVNGPLLSNIRQPHFGQTIISWHTATNKITQLSLLPLFSGEVTIGFKKIFGHLTIGKFSLVNNQTTLQAQPSSLHFIQNNQHIYFHLLTDGLSQYTKNYHLQLQRGELQFNLQRNNHKLWIIHDVNLILQQLKWVKDHDSRELNHINFSLHQDAKINIQALLKIKTILFSEHLPYKNLRLTLDMTSLSPSAWANLQNQPIAWDMALVKLFGNAGQITAHIHVLNQYNQNTQLQAKIILEKLLPFNDDNNLMALFAANYLWKTADITVNGDIPKLDLTTFLNLIWQERLKKSASAHPSSLADFAQPQVEQTLHDWIRRGILIEHQEWYRVRFHSPAARTAKSSQSLFSL